MAKQSKKLYNAFTEEHLEIIRKVYADTPNKVIATMIPHSATSISKKANTMGLKKTKEYIRENGRDVAVAQWNKLIEHNLQLSSNFKKGHVPWCKGKKLSSEHIAKLTGVFKKGQQPHNTLPIGSIRNINNYVEIKYTTVSNAVLFFSATTTSQKLDCFRYFCSYIPNDKVLRIIKPNDCCSP